ncbi:hypothetical protein TIFTF001_027697 [Ficus carica]|nr:hypothetical protein TIFTF001_027697 [Ficus carica]
MLVAGTETTSTTLEWLMAELVKNPRVMKKAQEEVRRTVGNKAKIDTNDDKSTELLEMYRKREHETTPCGSSFGCSGNKRERRESRRLTYSSKNKSVHQCMANAKKPEFVGQAGGVHPRAV